MNRLLAIVLLSSAIGCGAPPPAPEGGATETQSQELRIPNITVGKGTPTGTYFNGTLWLAYTGTDGYIHTLQRTGSSSFTDRRTIFTAHSGPSLIVYHGELFLTFVTFDNLISAKSSDGVQWRDAFAYPELPDIKYAPGMVVWTDVLIAFVTFNGTPTVMQYNYDVGSGRFSHVFNTSLETTVGPSAAQLGNDLFVAGVDGDGEVLTQKFDSVLGWQSPNPVHRRERGHLISAPTSPPSLLLLGSQLGNIGPNQIRFDRTLNGVDMTDLGHIGDTTKERPHGIRAGTSSVELVYRGTNNGLYLINVGLPAS